jgi:hypothetical protein
VMLGTSYHPGPSESLDVEVRFGLVRTCEHKRRLFENARYTSHPPRSTDRRAEQNDTPARATALAAQRVCETARVQRLRH